MLYSKLLVCRICALGASPVKTFSALKFHLSSALTAQLTFLALVRALRAKLPLSRVRGAESAGKRLLPSLLKLIIKVYGLIRRLRLKFSACVAI